MQQQNHDNLLNEKIVVHCPITDFDFLSEKPKLIQRRIASGSIPPPSSAHNHVSKARVR